MTSKCGKSSAFLNCADVKLVFGGFRRARNSAQKSRILKGCLRNNGLEYTDLWSLMDTPVWDDAILVIRGQLDEDQAALARRKAGDLDVHISLLAKWNTSSGKTRRQAVKLARALEMEMKMGMRMDILNTPMV